MKTVSINAEKREQVGKAASKKIRKQGMVPCIVYANNEATSFAAKPLELRDIIFTPDFKLAEINLDGKSKTCILKDVQFHPVTDEVIHVDFLELTEGATFKVEVPVRFKGTSKGVKAGGKLQQTVRKLKIKTDKEHLVDSITLDITNLKLGQSIRVRDVEPIEGVEIVNAPGIPVAIVEVPRALKSAGAKGAGVEEEEEETAEAEA